MKLVEKFIHKNDELVGVKHVSGSEPYVTGHYPHHLVYPGVLTLELIFEILRDYYQSDLEEISIKRVQFVSQIMPGDALNISIKVKSEENEVKEFDCNVNSIDGTNSILKVKALIFIKL